MEQYKMSKRDTRQIAKMLESIIGEVENLCEKSYTSKEEVESVKSEICSVFRGVRGIRDADYYAVEQNSKKDEGCLYCSPSTTDCSACGAKVETNSFDHSLGGIFGELKSPEGIY
ncbi:MAG: hypothetical protein FWE04_01705 [Oscillospiraceae bacterium]|nr:hypothetical protein [Oscillospiraceae bacterium]